MFKIFLILLTVVSLWLCIRQMVITLKARTRYLWGKNHLVLRMGHFENPYAVEYFKELVTQAAQVFGFVVLFYLTIKL